MRRWIILCASCLFALRGRYIGDGLIDNQEMTFPAMPIINFLVPKLLIVFFFISIFGNLHASASELTTLVQKIKPSVVTIVTYTKNKTPMALGTGFFIDDSGNIITNYHVLKGAYFAEVKTDRGEVFPITTVLAENKDKDLIKAAVDIPKDRVQKLIISYDKPLLAEKVVVIGSPKGLELTVSEGIISAIRELEGQDVIYQITAPISSGSSGSPVVNTTGDIIGVATFQYAEGQNLNFAVPSKYLKPLMRSEMPIPLKKWAAKFPAQIITPKRSTQDSTQKGTIKIKTEPQSARVRILNIKDKYFPGIQLPPGRYLIEVSAANYLTQKVWVELSSGQILRRKIALKESIVLKKAKNKYGMEFVKISGSGSGQYYMGSGTPKRYPVTVSSFFVQTTEVTQGQWSEIMGGNPSHFSQCGPDCPVENITWQEANEFIKRLNEKEKTTAYRLPTETEWEYASIGKGKSKECWNDQGTSVDDLSWYQSNSKGKTHPVGQKMPNTYGIHDMAGNVWEWCQDFYVEYPEKLYSDNDTSRKYFGAAPFKRRVLRGGGWNSFPDYLTCYIREIDIPGKLNVISVPPDAAVKITNKRIKYSPGVELPPGEYKLKITADGYETNKTVATIVGGVEQTVTVDLSPIDLRLFLGIPKKSGIDWDFSISGEALNKFLRARREAVNDEYLTLKGKDALGITEEAKTFFQNMISEYEAELDNYSQRSFFRYFAERDIKLHIHTIWLHEISENLDQFNAKQWKSNQVGFRVVKDAN